MKLIATYARVSTGRQEEEKTVQDQIYAFKEYVSKNDVKIVREYVDNGWSGDTLARPDLDNLRQDADKKIFDAVLFYDPDRIARRYSYQELVTDELQEAGVEVIFITIPTPKNHEERIVHGVRGLFAEYERMKIAERFRLGKVRKVKEGHVLTSQASYGHRYIANVKLPGQSMIHGHYEIVSEEAENLRNIFKWIDEEDLTLRRLVVRLQKLGIKPRKSKKGTWTTGTLSTLIRNKALIGEAHWGKSYACVPTNPQKTEKYKKMKKTSRRDKPEKDWVANKIPVPPIIDRELFMRVQEKLKSHAAFSKRNKKNDYLVGGKLWCVCGNRMSGNGKYQGDHIYYRCINRILNFPMPKTCHQRGINAIIVDKLFWLKFYEFLSSPDQLYEQAERWILNRQQGEVKSIENIDELKNELSKLKKQEDRLNKAHGAGAFTLEQLIEYTTPIKKQISDIGGRIMALEERERSQGASTMPTKEQIKAFAQKAAEKLRNLNFEEKRAIIISIVGKVIGSQEQLSVAGHVALNLDFNYVTLYSERGNRGAAQCRQIHIIQNHYQKAG